MRISEECSCGAKYTIDGPPVDKESLFKGINIWRKYHVCGTRLTFEVGVDGQGTTSPVPDEATLPSKAHRYPGDPIGYDTYPGPTGAGDIWSGRLYTPTAQDGGADLQHPEDVSLDEDSKYY